MRFTLKMMLIGFAVVGVTIGWMSKLWIEDPERFFQTLSIGSTVGPFIVATVTIIWLGFRGSRPSKSLAAWGAMLMLTPVLGLGVHWLLLPSGQPIRVLSNARLVEIRLPKQLNEPWTWNELEYRIGQSTLDKELVDASVRTLIAHMKQTSPQGWNQPLPWQRQFLAAARQKGLISVDVLLELCEAFYGPQPTVDPVAPLQEGDNAIDLRVRYGNPWRDNSIPGIVLVWHVNSVSLDGKPVTLENVQKHFGREWSGRLRTTLVPGEHEITIDVECAFIEESKLMGLDEDRIAPDEWPGALKRWKTQLSVPLSVEDESGSSFKTVPEKGTGRLCRKP